MKSSLQHLQYRSGSVRQIKQGNYVSSLKSALQIIHSKNLKIEHKYDVWKLFSFMQSYVMYASFFCWSSSYKIT